MAQMHLQNKKVNKHVLKALLAIQLHTGVIYYYSLHLTLLINNLLLTIAVNNTNGFYFRRDNGSSH